MTKSSASEGTLRSRDAESTAPGGEVVWGIATTCTMLATFPLARAISLQSVRDPFGLLRELTRMFWTVTVKRFRESLFWARLVLRHMSLT